MIWQESTPRRSKPGEPRSRKRHGSSRSMRSAASNTPNSIATSPRGRNRKTNAELFSAHPMAHVPDITVERAAEIKTLYERGEFTQKELGAMFGVHQTQASRIISGDRH